MLRHEVAVLTSAGRSPPALHPADRAILAGLSRLLRLARHGRFFVQPETLLRWRRDPTEVDLFGATVGTTNASTGHGALYFAWRKRTRLGLSADPREARHHGRPEFALERVGNPSPMGAHAAPIWIDLGRFKRAQAAMMLARHFSLLTRCCSAVSTCCSSSRSIPVRSNSEASPPTRWKSGTPSRGSRT